MNTATRTKFFYAFILVFFLHTTCLFAKNALFRYFSRFLDETRAELAISELIYQTLVSELPQGISITYDASLSKKMQEFADNSSKPEISYMVYVANSEIIDEVPLPNGLLILTKGILTKADTPTKLDYLLSRNVALITLGQPMKLIKQEGLYPNFLNELKLPVEKRNKELIRLTIRNYLRSLTKMNHKKADLQGLLLTKSPETTRKAAIDFLDGLSDSIWPIFSLNSGDVTQRILELKKIKLSD